MAGSLNYSRHGTKVSHSRPCVNRLLCQSRVAKIEKGDPTVSIDLILRAMFALCMNRKELAKAVWEMATNRADCRLEGERPREPLRTRESLAKPVSWRDGFHPVRSVVSPCKDGCHPVRAPLLSPTAPL